MMTSIMNIHLVLFIGVTCIIQKTVAACAYSDPRCRCPTINGVECTGLQELPPFTTDNDSSVVLYITFENGSITTISNNSLPPGLEQLVFRLHPLTNISDDALDTSAGTLRHLEISGAMFKNFPHALLKMTRLGTLYIKDTPIQYWDDQTIQHIAPNIWYLDLVNVSLSEWPKWMSYFSSLRVLDISGNSLKSIPDDAFSACNNTLSELNLGNTGLTQVTQALSTIRYLNYLVLDGNNLLQIDNPYRLGSKLEYLLLKSVGLTRVSNFSNLTKLTTVYLDNNNISDSTAGSFPPSVTELTLSGNLLSSVPVFVANMSKLSDLDLSKNQIAELKPDSFPPSLVKLDLSYNKLTIISNTSFDNLTLLTMLEMNNNPITTISYLAFENLVSLDGLYLDSTNLTQVPLALGRLVYRRIIISLQAIPSLSCACQAPAELVDWYRLSKIDIYIYGICSDGTGVLYHLVTPCPDQPTPADPITTTHGSAPGGVQSPIYICGCLFLLLSLWLFSN